MEHGFDLGKLLRRQALEDTPERSVCAINGEGSLQEGSRRIQQQGLDGSPEFLHRWQFPHAMRL
jgi:hypothetical protein